MKFYDTSSAPSPRRVRIFLAEKGIEIPTVQVDLRAGAHLQPDFLKINPAATVPVLELDDGTTISEAIACCRYLEEANPEPPLMGRDPKDKAVIAMWEHRCEIEGFLAVAEALRNEAKGMKGRALPGPVGHEQIPALVERGRARVAQFFAWLNERLGESRIRRRRHLQRGRHHRLRRGRFRRLDQGGADRRAEASASAGWLHYAVGPARRCSGRTSPVP